MKINYSFLILVIASLTAGIFLGREFWPQRSRGSILRESIRHYDFIDPIIACEVAPASDFPELSGLQKAFQAIIDQSKATGKISTLSVYFRGLKSGRWIDLNNGEKYRPASLLKVLTAIAHFKLDERSRDHLIELVRYDDKVNEPRIDNNIVDPKLNLQNGQWYSVRELVERLLTNSDNQSNNTLLENISPDYLETVYGDLGIPLPDLPGSAFISPSSYSIAFRVLYGATYLDRDDSEKLLQIMTQSTFNDGLTAGLPKKIVVAHKFGFRRREEPRAKEAGEELHDCGIVYYPNHPYFLCVMTKGNNYQSLAGAIAQISKTAYDWQNSFWSKQQ